MLLVNGHVHFAPSKHINDVLQFITLVECIVEPDVHTNAIYAINNFPQGICVFLRIFYFDFLIPVFLHRCNMNTHRRNHATPPPGTIFTCDYCKKCYNNKNGLKFHMRQRHVFEPTTCPICGKMYNNAKKLTNHKKTHNKTTKFECDICGKFYWQKRYLILHMTNSHEQNDDVQRYVCDRCGRSFSKKTSYFIHKRLPCTKQRIPRSVNKMIRPHNRDCYICSKPGSDIKALRVHYRKQHKDAVDALSKICLTCNMQFACAAELNEHKKPNGNAYKCKECPSARLECENAFTQHVGNHSAIREHSPCHVSIKISRRVCSIYSHISFHRSVVKFCWQKEV